MARASYSTGGDIVLALPSDELDELKTLRDESRRLIATLQDPGPRAASTELRFAASVAGFGMLLRDSEHQGESSYDLVLELARSVGFEILLGELLAQRTERDLEVLKERGAADDILIGGSGKDRLNGRGGNDVITGGPNGNDTICGGPGNDTAYSCETATGL